MSEPQVTITLGRTGQVVTKGGKRSRGDNSNGYFSSNTSKRLRGSNSKWIPGVDKVNGFHIARNDLRLKLNRKRASKQIQNTDEGRQKTNARENPVKPLDPTMSSYMLYHRPDSSGSNLSRRIPPNNANGMHSMDSWRNLHTSQTMGGPRAGSPDRIFKSSNVLLPSKSVDQMPKVSWMRSTDDLRGVRHFSNEVLGSSRQTGPIPFTIKTPAQAVNPLNRAVQSNGIVQNISHTREEPLTVAGFLHALGLGKYAIHFQAEEVDMTVLKQMGDNDLKEMGIPMGPRKKILLALLARHKQQPSRLQH